MFVITEFVITEFDCINKFKTHYVHQWKHFELSFIVFHFTENDLSKTNRLIDIFQFDSRSFMTWSIKLTTTMTNIKKITEKTFFCSTLEVSWREEPALRSRVCRRPELQGEAPELPGFLGRPAWIACHHL